MVIVVGGVRCVGAFARLVDKLMVPVMYLVSGTFKERPQENHPWHVRSLKPDEKARLVQKNMVHCSGIKAVQRKHAWSVLYHIPALGGWKHYVVLAVPGHTGNWHVGWIAPDQTRFSRLALRADESVRTLLGPGDVSFFAIDDDGNQFVLVQEGEGRVGDGGPHRKVRLL